jgi:hypothetical protein
MTKIKKMTLHANKSVAKEENGGISGGRCKSLSFRFGMKTYSVFKYVCVATIIVVASCFIISCSQDDDTISLKTGDNQEYLSLSVSNFDFARDWDNLSEIDKNTFRSAKKRMDLTFDKNGIYRTKWTSSKQVNISDELFDFFINTIVLTNEAIRIVYLDQVTSPRLKNGNEGERWECCVIQSLLYVLQNFGAPGGSNGSFGLGAINSWVTTNNYYTYDDQYQMWGANIPATLSHYLEGYYIDKNIISEISSPPTNSQFIIVLKGPPAHVVVFTGSNSGVINYYDPQNGCSGQCNNINDIGNVYRANGYCQDIQ